MTMHKAAQNQLVPRIVGIGPMVYAVRWKRNVYLGMAVHCALTTLAVALTTSSVLPLIYDHVSNRPQRRMKCRSNE